MRTAFVTSLESEAERNPDLLLLTGDLGFGVLNTFSERFPNQLYNVGVAEQNLAGVGAGLALSGHTVFTYSIGNFPTLRCLEQVRNDIGYHQVNVNMVTVGGGMAYGALGYSHFATEDLAIMRALPGITVVAPGDPVEVRSLVPQIAQHPGPVYLRLGRAGESDVLDADVEVVLGEPTVVRKGTGVLLLTTGGMLPVAMTAAAMLSEHGIDPCVASVHTLSPFDPEWICSKATEFDIVITCEEHTVVGGLGGAVAEAIAEGGIVTRFKRFGLSDKHPEAIGSQEFLRAANGIDETSLVELVRSMIS